MGGERDHSFRNLLEEAGIAQSQMIPIEFVNVRDGGAFANNLTWLVNLMTVECNCRCFVFWNVGTSFLLAGGSVTDPLNINKHVQSVVEDVDVQIRSRAVDPGRKFVLVPLVYNKFTCDRDFKDQDMARDRGFTPVLGQSFSKFMKYNRLVIDDVKTAYPDTYKELGAPTRSLPGRPRHPPSRRLVQSTGSNLFLPLPPLGKVPKKTIKSLKCWSVRETRESCDLICSFQVQTTVTSLIPN